MYIYYIKSQNTAWAVRVELSTLSQIKGVFLIILTHNCVRYIVFTSSVFSLCDNTLYKNYKM